MAKKCDTPNPYPISGSGSCTKDSGHKKDLHSNGFSEWTTAQAGKSGTGKK